MSRFTDWTFRLRALFGRGSLESQVDQEFAFHVRMEAEKLQREGWAAEAAVGTDSARVPNCCPADRLIDCAIDGPAKELTQCEWIEGHFSLRQRR